MTSLSEALMMLIWYVVLFLIFKKESSFMNCALRKMGVSISTSKQQSTSHVIKITRAPLIGLKRPEILLTIIDFPLIVLMRKYILM